MRAPNVQLSGVLESGFQDRQWLVQRDGTFIQLPEVFYRILELADGIRTLDAIAASVSDAMHLNVSAAHVRLIIASKLIPKGLVAATASAVGPASGSSGRAPARSALAVNLRMKMLSPRLIDPMTWVLQFLYVPSVLVAVLIAAAASHVWLYWVHGLNKHVYQMLASPRLILVLVPILIVAAAFHELGHAAALRYGGGQVRGIGAGLYLVYPVFYTDVTDSYRLGRWARVRTDLGGFYFNLIFALGLLALYTVTEQEVLLLAVLLLDLQILYQCLPFVRFDGYWALADLVGVPDFFSQMGAFVRSVVPLPHWKGHRLPPLKGWVKLVFAVYILVTVPLLCFLLVLMLKQAPRAIATTWESLGKELSTVATARQTGDLIGMAAALVHIATLALPACGLLLVLFNLGRGVMRAVWAWSKPSPMRRALGALGALAASTGMALLWVPQHLASMLPILSRLLRLAVATVAALWERAAAFFSAGGVEDVLAIVVAVILTLVTRDLLCTLFGPMRRGRRVQRAGWNGSEVPPTRRPHGGQQVAAQQRDGSQIGSAARGLYTYAAARIRAGASASEVLGRLITRGVDPALARQVVQQAQQATMQAGRVPAQKVEHVESMGPRWLQRLAAWSLAGVLLLGLGYGLRDGASQRPVQAQQPGASLVSGMDADPDSTQTRQQLGTAVAQAPVVSTSATTVPSPTASPGGQIQGVTAAGGTETREGVTPAAAPDATAAPPVQPRTTATAQSTATRAPTDPPPAVTPPSVPDALVVAQRLNVRAGPDATYPVLRQLTADAPLDIVGQANSLNWFKIRLPDGQEGWIAGDTQLVHLNTARESIPPASFRPPTGPVQQLELPEGLGELHIDNHGPAEGLVVVARGGRAVVAAYVRAGEAYTITGIPDGSYSVFTSVGEDWDGSTFTRRVKRMQYPEAFVFQTTPREYTVWEISIDADTVPADQFPSVIPDLATEMP